MTRFRIFLFLSLVSFSTVALATDRKPIPADGGKEGIQFFTGSWKEALAKAKAEKKLVFLDAYAAWCGPCKMMQARTFPDKRVGEFFNQKFISVKIDMEKGEGPALANVYPLEAYPTLFFMNSQGKVVKKVEGALMPDQLLSLARQVAK